MDFWPKGVKSLKKISWILFSLLVMAVGLLVWQNRLLTKSQSLPNLATSSLHIPLQQPPEKTQTPNCPQQTDETGYKIVDNRLVVYPRCLLVMNSRFGSRFNFDWHSAKQNVMSGTLGTLQDQNTNLVIKIINGQNIRQVWPALNNSQAPTITTELGLTYQKINFEYPDLVLSFTITSPFSPSQSAEDENTKLSTTPFFYLDLSLTNKTNHKQNPVVSLSMGQSNNIKTDNNRKIIYFSDTTSVGAVKTMAFLDNKTVLPFINQGAGGINWQTELEPRGNDTTAIVYAGYNANAVINDISRENMNRELSFAYTRWFKNVEEVLNFAFDKQQETVRKTGEFEKQLGESLLTPKEKWLAAQAFHSYLGNSWLVVEKDKTDPEYYVWEGEFKYLNTADVAHDYAVLEGLYFSWVIKKELLSWQLNAKKDEKGMVIPHDLGRKFTIEPNEAYRIPGWQTSGMPAEENLNYILLTYWYWHQTKDDRYIRDQTPFISQLVESIINRDSNGNGIVDTNLGITTYDNDGNSALKEAPDSTYLGVKQLGAYLSAEKMFEVIKDNSGRELVNKQAKLITESLKKIYQEKGFIPLSLDPYFEEKNLFNGKKIKGIDEQGFAFISGLFYPALTGLKSKLLDELKPIFKDSYQKAYQKSLVQNEKGKAVCLQLAENQALSLGWFSHSMMGDFIANRLLNLSYSSSDLFFDRMYDTPFGFTDGHYFCEPFYPPLGALLYYPRGVTFFGRLLQN